MFKDEEAVAEEAPAEGEGEEGEEVQVAKEPEEQFPRHVYVPEVVREPRMHYYKVPKLGSFLAIKLEYESCQFEGGLDSAVLDFIDVRQRQRQ